MIDKIFMAKKKSFVIYLTHIRLPSLYVLDSYDSYKYLGVIQADGMKHHKMKEKVRTESHR